MHSAKEVTGPYVTYEVVCLDADGIRIEIDSGRLVKPIGDSLAILL